MSTTLPHEPQVYEPRLLIEWSRPDRGSWYARIAGASVLAHLLFGAIAVMLLTGPVRVAPRTSVEVRRQATPLIAPPRELTQRAPNRDRVNREFNLESLPSRAQNPTLPRPGAVAPAPRAAQKFTPPKPKALGPLPQALPEAPAIATGGLRSPAPAPQGIGTQPQAAPPPRIQTEEKPKLAFETPGAVTGAVGQQGTGRIPTPPRASVEEAVRQMARGGGGRPAVGDMDDNSASTASGLRSPIPGRLGSGVELLSDPMGADFRPYLIQVLAAVQRNWFAVIPESAKLGQKGRVAIQFAINRDGGVPKLVIATPSGKDALDRAAVAGISASNPFPPLPNDYRGGQIRLQLVFRYNLVQ